MVSVQQTSHINFSIVTFKPIGMKMKAKVTHVSYDKIYLMGYCRLAVLLVLLIFSLSSSAVCVRTRTRFIDSNRQLTYSERTHARIMHTNTELVIFSYIVGGRRVNSTRNAMRRTKLQH